MQVLYPRHWLVAVCLIGLYCHLPWKTLGQRGPSPSVFIQEGCSEFSNEERLPSGWLHADCVDVWTSWTNALPAHVFGPFPERAMLIGTATELRSRGSPCLVQSGNYSDGVGSSTIRHLASWMFAEEIGCDWMTPRWNKKSIDDHGTVLYCHETSTVAERDDIRLGKAVYDPRTSRCALHNWVAYFGFDSHSVSRPTKGSYKVVEVRKSRMFVV